MAASSESQENLQFDHEEYDDVGGGDQDYSYVPDRFLPMANIRRIMRKGLPPYAKISQEAKDTVQDCVTEFISFVTVEANDKCKRDKRKTVTGDDILWAMDALGFDDYVGPLKVYLRRYRESEADKTFTMKKPGEASSTQKEGEDKVEFVAPMNVPPPDVASDLNWGGPASGEWEPKIMPPAAPADWVWTLGPVKSDGSLPDPPFEGNAAFPVAATGWEAALPAIVPTGQDVAPPPVAPTGWEAAPPPVAPIEMDAAPPPVAATEWEAVSPIATQSGFDPEPEIQ